MSQLSFDLPAIAALGREDFFASPANAVALGMIDLWPDWPDRRLLIVGPRGAGKTHLAHVWASRSAARIVAAETLDEHDIAELVSGHLVVENVDAIAGTAAAEQALFHLHNLLLAEGRSLLLTARRPPMFWPLTLPDLASRMQACHLAEIAAPDDLLLAFVLGKLFSDRQIVPDAAVIPYLLRRIDRSFAAANAAVDAIDALALSEGRDVSRAVAARVLDDLESLAD
ncbi:MAG: DnaA/Hda family protein [Pseudooceanicola sp.]|nr:DnaA/Hda family protein [Pseudooceanicola sp.]